MRSVFHCAENPCQVAHAEITKHVRETQPTAERKCEISDRPKGGLNYEDCRYVAKRVRKECELRPAKMGRTLPNVLTPDNYRNFYMAVDQADNVQHSLVLRLLFFTAVRVGIRRFRG